MTDDTTPSRFHASPAEIDAFLREHFAEDALLNFYQAVGDEVLDEIQASGQTFRRLKEQAQGKHVYLSGIADVLAYIQDDRYFPARLPNLTSYDRAFNPPRANVFRPGASDRKFEGLLEEASFGAPHVRAGGESNPIPEQVMERFRVASQALRCTKCGGISGDHADWAKGHLFNPPAPADTSASEPCYRKNTHPAHKWLKNRRQAQCPGNTIEETP